MIDLSWIQSGLLHVATLDDVIYIISPHTLNRHDTFRLDVIYPKSPTESFFGCCRPEIEDIKRFAVDWAYAVKANLKSAKRRSA